MASDETLGTEGKAASAVIDGLRAIGYLGTLLEERYSFPDWFDNQHERVTIAAAFGETPPSYDTACIGVVRSNGLKSQELVNGFRALGAPIVIEIDQAAIREWEVSRSENQHRLVGTYASHEIVSVCAQRAHAWKPDTLLRAKNIGGFYGDRQRNLFSGLLPELENQIQAQLDPLLRQTLAATRSAYLDATGREPNPEHLFKLIFWMLTAKVFRDRKVGRFTALSADPDEVLYAVATQYKQDPPKLLTKEAREIAASLIWDELDFRNLSVDVLSQIWSTTLVDADTRKRLGIHRTPRNIVRYIVERIPFSGTGNDRQIVFEPCCGSAAFLIGAMHVLRKNLYGAEPRERHEYFINHLAGVEYDPFGAEISTLALTLADFPNTNGWDITTADVFQPGAMSNYLRRAGVVLCNPPFEDFQPEEQNKYKSSAPKPAELLSRVLDDLHQTGVLGFVLPQVAIDGQSYAPIRERLAKRFANLEFTVLPDKAFQADAEVALLIATDPIPHDITRVAYRRVRDDSQAWADFDRDHRVSVDYSDNFGIQRAREGFRIPELPEVWHFLRDNPLLGDVARIHRGLEWKLRLGSQGKKQGHRALLVHSSEGTGYRRGVPPKAKFNMFEKPAMAYLSVRPEHQLYEAYKLDWDRPKAILNKTTRSRGSWRIAAFVDREGVACYQTFDGVWPTARGYDEVVLAAVLNSPVANAFVTTREGKVDIRLQTLRSIPMPVFTDAQRATLHDLVARYERAIGALTLDRNSEDLERLLKEIDALVLDGYRMPANLERQVLDLFRGNRRAVAHEFGDYFPPDFEANFSLSDFIKPDFASANAGELLKAITNR